MNPDWHTFLTGQGARFDGEHPTGFETAASTHAAGTLVDLSQDGIIAVSGDDARGFLQGQLSTDIDALTSGLSQLSSWSNAKGRVITVLRVVEYGDRLLLLLPRSLLPTVLKRLSMYVLRAKVTLSDVSDTLVHIGFSGTDARPSLASAQLPAPQNVNAVAEHGDARIVRLHGTLPRYMMIGPVDALVAIWEKLSSSGASAADAAHWRLQKILAMEPTLYPETSEHFVAQMIGLEELDAINFKKGCYIGQEIIARAHFRGAVKRHMLRAQCQTPAMIIPGTEIHLAGTLQAVAEVVDAAPAPQGGEELLIVVQDEHRHSALQLADTGHALTLVQPA